MMSSMFLFPSVEYIIHEYCDADRCHDEEQERCLSEATPEASGTDQCSYDDKVDADDSGVPGFDEQCCSDGCEWYKDPSLTEDAYERHERGVPGLVDDVAAVDGKHVQQV